MTHKINRRDFVVNGTAAGLALTIPSGLTTQIYRRERRERRERRGKQEKTLLFGLIFPDGGSPAFEADAT